MSLHSTAHLLLAAMLFAIPANASPAPGASIVAPAPSARDEADAKTLAAILTEQEVLFESLRNDASVKSLPQAEKERRVLELLKRYSALLERRPYDVAVMILYGKFLRLVDAREEANRWFSKADALAPGMAVLKHQLGVYAAEEGRIVSALDLLETAIRLEPGIAAYHCHFGEFLAIYREHLVRENLLKRADCDAKMQGAFLRAAELNPSELGYLWRHAESFFDCEKPDWNRALAAWNFLGRKLKAEKEREVLGLYRARVLLELGRAGEAQRLLDASKSPALEASRKKLRVLLDEKTAKPHPVGHPPKKRTGTRLDARMPSKGAAPQA